MQYFAEAHFISYQATMKSLLPAIHMSYDKDCMSLPMPESLFHSGNRELVRGPCFFRRHSHEQRGSVSCLISLMLTQLTVHGGRKS